MEREFIDGATVISRAALLSGCNFFAGYPITPATQILINMTNSLPKIGGVAIQGEDEIASISMCISASLCGKKSMTATSGPGISLYSESIGLAMATETPLVIVNVQRLGPATGGATTGAQGDIQFMRWVTSGGLPMIILSPKSIESMFTLTIHAFNIAEILRTPVFLATSKDMVLSMHTLQKDNLKIPEIVNRKYFDGEEKYVPYKIKNLNDVPLFLPLGGNQIVRHTTSMHDEEGYLTKVPEKIERTFLHLEKKITENRHLFEFVEEDLEIGSKNLIIAYDVNSGVCKEVVKTLRREGKKCSLLILETLFPEPKEKIENALKGIEKIIVPEMNIGLYAETLKKFLKPNQELISISKVNGELISPNEIIEKGKLYE